MKKTLFLSAILATALCSSAFAAEGFINESAYGWVYYMTADNQTIESISKDEAGFKIWADNGNGTERLTETVTNLSIGEGKTVTVEHSGWGGNARYFKLLTVDTLSAAANSTLVVTDGNVMQVNNVSGSLKAMTIGNDTTDTTTYTDKDTTLTLTNGATLTGMLSFHAGNLNVTGGTFTAGSFDMNCTGNKAAGQMNLSGTAKASTNTMWMGHNAAITLTDEAQFSFNSRYIMTAQAGKSATLTRNDESGGSYTIGSGAYTISNAAVSILANDITLGNKLDGVTLDGTDKNVTLSGTISGASVISNATLSGQIAGGTITDSVYRGNNMTGGTLNNVELVFNERLNIHGGGHVTLGNVTNHITASTYNYGIVVYDANTSVTVNGTTDLVTGANGRDKIGLGDGNTLTVQAGGHLISGALYTSENSLNGEFTVEAGGQMDVKGKTHIKTLSNAGTTSIQNALNAATIINSGTLTAASLAAADNQHAGVRADVTNSGTLQVTGDAAINTLTITSGSVTLGSATAGINTVVNSGSLNISAAAATITDLTLNRDAVVELQSDHSGTLTTSTLTVSGDATINANLVVTDYGTMDFSNHTALTMGCTVTIGDYVTIMIDDSELADIVSGNSVMTIINDVEGVDMNNLALTLGSGWKFVDAQGNSLDGYNLRLDVVDAGEGKVNIVVAPEPATATLSLLALAALASRRRRH